MLYYSLSLNMLEVNCSRSHIYLATLIIVKKIYVRENARQLMQKCILIPLYAGKQFCTTSIKNVCD